MLLIKAKNVKMTIPDICEIIGAKCVSLGPDIYTNSPSYLIDDCWYSFGLSLSNSYYIKSRCEDKTTQDFAKKYQEFGIVVPVNEPDTFRIDRDPEMVEQKEQELKNWVQERKENLKGSTLINELKSLASMLKQDSLNFSSKVAVEIPKEILEDLSTAISYADAPPMKEKTREWIKENLPRETMPMTLFRGTGIFLDDEALGQGDWSDTPPENTPEEFIRKAFGIGFKDLREGATVTIKRGEESSWTKARDVAEEFQTQAEEGGEPYQIGILLEAKISAEDILLDTTKLPEDIQNHLGFSYQEEVIVENVPIKAKILDIKIDSIGLEWLEENGFEFKNGKIIQRLP